MSATRAVGVARRRCAFIDRPCEVESDSVPLEVCRLCLDAWKAAHSTIMVSRPLITPEISQPASERPAEAVEAKPAGAKPVESKDLSEELSKLDKLLFEGKISVEEYLEKRKKLVGSSASSTSWLKQMEEQWLGKLAQPLPYAVLMEDGKVKALYPEGWTPPKSLAKALKPLYELCSALGGGDLHLEAGAFKVTVLGYRDGKLAMLLLERGTGFSYLDEVVEEARARLKASSDWEKALGALYDERLRLKRPTYVW